MKRATKKTGRTFRTNVKDEEQRQELKRIGRHPLKKSPRGQTVEIRLKPDLHKRPYGLLEGAGISSDGLTPGQAWAAWDAYRRDVAAMKREAKNALAKAKPKAAKEKYPERTVRELILHGTTEERERYMKTLSPADRAKMQKELDKQKQPPAKAEKPTKQAEKRNSKVRAKAKGTGRKLTAPASAVKAMKKMPVKKEEGRYFTSKRYDISEDAAARAKEMTSFFDYKQGSATAGYRAEVASFDEKVNKLFEKYKNNDSLTEADRERALRIAERYSKKLAESTNKINEIEGRYPSWFIAGPAKYNVGRHEKKMSALDKAYKERPEEKEYLQRIQGILSNRAIASGDENAAGKLQKKLKDLEAEQERDKEMNAYFRKHKTIVGFEGISEREAKAWQEKHDSGDYFARVPVYPWQLSNRNAEMRRLKERIATLEKEKNAGTRSHTYAGLPGLEVVENTENMRIQLKFDGKPDEATRATLKGNGFRWSPKEGAWQRQLNNNGRYAAKNVLQKLKDKDK